MLLFRVQPAIDIGWSILRRWYGWLGFNVFNSLCSIQRQKHWFSASPLMFGWLWWHWKIYFNLSINPESESIVIFLFLFLLHIYQFDIKTTASEAWYPFYASMSKRWVVAVVGDIFICCNNEYYSHLKQTITSRDTLLSAIACSFAGLGQNENNLTLIHWQVYILS